MKVTNKILGGLFILLLAACASGPEKENTDSDSSDSYAAPAPAKSSQAKESVAEAPRPVAAPPSANEVQALTEAIKGGNDESISRAAIVVLSKNPNDTKALNALGMTIEPQISIWGTGFKVKRP
jgi:predicted lipid-binding transport protein (Tim44 family)